MPRAEYLQDQERALRSGGEPSSLKRRCSWQTSWFRKAVKQCSHCPPSFTPLPLYQLGTLKIFHLDRWSSNTSFVSRPRAASAPNWERDIWLLREMCPVNIDTRVKTPWSRGSRRHRLLKRLCDVICSPREVRNTTTPSRTSLYGRRVALVSDYLQNNLIS